MRLYSREQKSTVFLMFTLVDFAKKYLILNVSAV